MLSKHAAAAATMDWHRVVIDESQRVRNARTISAKACVELRADRRWLIMVEWQPPLPWQLNAGAEPLCVRLDIWLCPKLYEIRSDYDLYLLMHHLKPACPRRTTHTHPIGAPKRGKRNFCMQSARTHTYCSQAPDYGSGDWEFGRIAPTPVRMY